jgi:ComF family protein
VSLSPFDGTLKELIHRYKYSGKDYLAAVLARLLLKEWPACPFEVDAIIAVPMPFWREVRRGYNQSFLLAKHLGKIWEKPVIKGGIQRRWNRSQTNLTRAERLTNAARGFRMQKSAGPPDKHVLLVDDVLTTGATLDACARLLKNTGVSRVSALTVAYD